MPIPRPICASRVPLAIAREPIEDLRQYFLRYAGAIVGNADHQALFVLGRIDADLAAPTGLNLELLFRMPANTCTMRRLSTCSHTGTEWQVHAQVLLAAFQDGAIGLDGPLQQRLQRDAFAAQFQVSLRHVRHIGQILDQTRQLH